MKLYQNKRGFTLIELLVVIAIIALLLAILMPALKKAKAIARNVVCRTNIKSLITGFKLHVESNDQQLISNDGVLWLTEIEDQVGEIDKVRYCPETKLNKNFPLTWPNGFGDAKTTWAWAHNITDDAGNPIPPGQVTYDVAEHGSYSYNYYFYRFENEASYFQGHWRTPNPPNSSNVPIFADCKGQDFMPKNADVPSNLDLNKGGNFDDITGYVTNRHKAVTNVGFIDGHVELIKLENLWLLKWGKDFQTQGVKTRQDGSPIYQR